MISKTIRIWEQEVYCSQCLEFSILAGSKKWFEILGFYVIFAKIFPILTIFKLCLEQGRSLPHLQLFPSHWYSQNICWINEYKNECMHSLNRDGLISGDIFWRNTQNFLLALMITFYFPSHSKLFLQSKTLQTMK